MHLLACQLDVEADGARIEGSIIIQLQNVGEQQRLKNRKAIKALIRCTHFLAHQHIAHTTIFDKLVELVVSWGKRLFKPSLTELKEMQRTPQMAVVEFENALVTSITIMPPPPSLKSGKQQSCAGCFWEDITLLNSVQT